MAAVMQEQKPEGLTVLYMPENHIVNLVFVRIHADAGNPMSHFRFTAPIPAPWTQSSTHAAMNVCQCWSCPHSTRME